MTGFERLTAGILLVLFGLGMATLLALAQIEGEITIRTRTFDREITPVPYWALYLLQLAVTVVSLLGGVYFFMQMF